MAQAKELVAGKLAQVDARIAAGPFADEWPSLQQYQVPQWYADAKLGIFIHWGVYSVPAFGNEWYPRNMYRKGAPEYEHHLKTYGPHDRFGYKDLIPAFKAEQFDAQSWVDLFAEAGARFVVPVAEHHDGFAMYECPYSSYNAVERGPRRDVTGELAAAVRKKGLIFGVSYHRAEHWWFFEHGRDIPSDVTDPGYERLYGPAAGCCRHGHHDYAAEPAPDTRFCEEWLARAAHLIDSYQPQLFWFDWWIQHRSYEPFLRKFGAFYYNRGVEWGKEVALNYKNESFAEGSAVLDLERGQLADMRAMLWQTDTSVARNSWCFTEGNQYKTPGSIIQDLVDIVAKNGVLLLNIGPRPDGTIPAEDQHILREIGKWLKINGEAIYGTRPWRVFGEGPTEVKGGHFTDTARRDFTPQDIRFVRASADPDTLYAILLAWPVSGEVLIRSLGGNLRLQMSAIKEVRLLGCDAPLAFTRFGEGLLVKLPETPPCDYAYALKVSLG